MKECQFCKTTTPTFTIDNPDGEYPDEKFTVCAKCWDTVFALVCKMMPAFTVYAGEIKPKKEAK